MGKKSTSNARMDPSFFDQGKVPKLLFDPSHKPEEHAEKKRYTTTEKEKEIIGLLNPLHSCYKANKHLLYHATISITCVYPSPAAQSLFIIMPQQRACQLAPLYSPLTT